MSLCRMAWRNLWRNRRRTAVTAAAMSLALLSMILYTGLMEGMLADMEANLLDLELGEVQVFAPGYQDKPQIHTRLRDAEALVGRLRARGLDASARLLASGLAASRDTSAGVLFRGVDPAQDRQVSRIYAKLAQGRWLDAAAPGGVVLGRRLAHTLGVKPGDELVVLGQGADGSMANELFRVRGVLRGVSAAVDQAGVFLTAGAFRQLFVVPSGSHQIIVRAPRSLPLGETLALVRSLAPGQDAQSWRQLMPTLASMVDNARGMQGVMMVIVYLAIAIVILNAMLMAVFERIREFGVLKALGMGPGAVLRLVLTETSLLVLLAVAAGGAASLPGLWYLSTTGLDLAGMSGISLHGMSWDMTWRARVSPATFLRPVSLLAGVVCLAAIYPALKAALISPLAAMRHH